ncbi:MAG: hypothetical protein ACMG6E_10155 [Candidatus Roizmanbacteria bacterium]
MKMCEKQDEEEENATRKMVENLTQSICKQAIFSQEDKQKNESVSAPVRKEDSKNKKKKNKKQKKRTNSQNKKPATE